MSNTIKGICVLFKTKKQKEKKKKKERKRNIPTACLEANITSSYS